LIYLLPKGLYHPLKPRFQLRVYVPYYHPFSVRM
jgi:hypothetical protein